MNNLWEDRWGWDLSQIACLDSWTGSCGLWIPRQEWKLRSQGEWHEERVSAVGLLVRERRSLDILPVKNKKQSCLQVKCQEKWWEAVNRICGVGVYWLFAKDAWGYRSLKIRGWNSTLFLENSMSLWYWLRRDLKEDQSAAEWVRFHVFSMAEGRPKCTEDSSKPWFDGDWRLESLLMMGACLSSREDRVVF